jgi:hypothetical protein
LHVEEDSDLDNDQDIGINFYNSYESFTFDSACDKLELLAYEYRNKVSNWEVKTGSTIQALIEGYESGHAGLIICGARKETDFPKSQPRNSIALELLSQTNAPTLIIPEKAECDGVMNGNEITILVVDDLTANSDNALQAALDLAVFRERCKLIHCCTKYSKANWVQRLRNKIPDPKQIVKMLGYDFNSTAEAELDPNIFSKELDEEIEKVMNFRAGLKKEKMTELGGVYQRVIINQSDERTYIDSLIDICSTNSPDIIFLGKQSIERNRISAKELLIYDEIVSLDTPMMVISSELLSKAAA